MRRCTKTEFQSNTWNVRIFWHAVKQAHQRVNLSRFRSNNSRLHPDVRNDESSVNYLNERVKIIRFFSDPEIIHNQIYID